MPAVMDEGRRLEISRFRLAMGGSSIVYLLCTLLMAAAMALYLGTGETLFLFLPLPFLLPVLPAAFRAFRLVFNPVSAIQLDRDGVRLGEDILPYESIQWAELNGPVGRASVRFVCVPGAYPPFRTLPFQGRISGLTPGLTGFYDPTHLDFVQEINQRARMAGNPGIR